jgi:hypothetical protein
MKTSSRCPPVFRVPTAKGKFVPRVRWLTIVDADAELKLRAQKFATALASVRHVTAGLDYAAWCSIVAVTAARRLQPHGALAIAFNGELDEVAQLRPSRRPSAAPRGIAFRWLYVPWQHVFYPIDELGRIRQ